MLLIIQLSTSGCNTQMKNWPWIAIIHLYQNCKEADSFHQLCTLDKKCNYGQIIELAAPESHLQCYIDPYQAKRPNQDVMCLEKYYLFTRKATSSNYARYLLMKHLKNFAKFFEENNLD